MAFIELESKEDVINLEYSNLHMLYYVEYFDKFWKETFKFKAYLVRKISEFLMFKYKDGSYSNFEIGRGSKIKMLCLYEYERE